MDKLRTFYKKGAPAVQELFGFLQDTYTDAFKQLLNGLGASQTNFILHGCDYTETSTEYNINSGAVVLNGELLIVDAHTVTKQSQVNYFWDTVESDYPEGQFDFLSGSNNIFARRRGKIVKGDLPSGHGRMLLTSPVRITDVIDEHIGSRYLKNQSLSLITPSLQNGWLQDIGNGHQAMSYWKTQEGMVYVQGWVNVSSATDFTIFTLPADYRPFHQVHGNIIDTSAGYQVFAEADGRVRVNNYSTSHETYFIQIIFPII